MLSLETSSNWAIEVEVDDGVNPPQTFVNATTANSVKASLDAFCTWLVAQFGGTASWSWARDATRSRAALTVTVSNALSFTAGAYCTDRWGLDTDGPVTTWDTRADDEVGEGTWCPVPDGLLAVSGVRCWSSDRGDGNAAGAVLPWAAGIVGCRPDVSAIASVQDVAVLASQLRLAANPRRAWIYQSHTATWWRFALGDVTREQAGTTLYRVAIEAFGEAI